MSNDLWYNPGDNYILDDISGFKIRTSRARMIPGGQTGKLWVAPERWEPQQSQDFVQGVRDDQTVAVSRSRQQNQFVIVGGQVTTAAAAQSTSLTLDSVFGFVVGARCQVPLDNGTLFFFNITSISGTTLTFAGQPLPWSVGGTFADPLENAVLQLSLGNAVSYLIELEDGTGTILLEDGSGSIELEAGP